MRKIVIIIVGLILIGVAAVIAFSVSDKNEQQSAVSDSSSSEWIKFEDEGISLLRPNNWTPNQETNEQGNTFVTIESDKKMSGYPQAIVIGRTADVADNDFDKIVDLFKNVQGDRKYGEMQDIDVKGSSRAALLESTKNQGEQQVPVRSWNVFVLSDSNTNFNIEFIAPLQLFDENLFNQILDTLEVR